MTASDTGCPLADRCEVCDRPLISRRVRRTGRCGAHPRQPVLPDPDPPNPPTGRHPR